MLITLAQSHSFNPISISLSADVVYTEAMVDP
jgi:hypothetical protein